MEVEILHPGAALPTAVEGPHLVVLGVPVVVAAVVVIEVLTLEVGVPVEEAGLASNAMRKVICPGNVLREVVAVVIEVLPLEVEVVGEPGLALNAMRKDIFPGTVLREVVVREHALNVMKKGIFLGTVLKEVGEDVAVVELALNAMRRGICPGNVQTEEAGVEVHSVEVNDIY